MPDVLEMSDPPIIVRNRKYRLKLLSVFIKVRPEFAKLLKTLIVTLNPSKLLN